MSLKINNLETFKKHRHEISESLTTNLVGRENEIIEISSKIDDANCLVITGPAGVGKSRLAVGAIEYYCTNHYDIHVLCTNNFSDYIHLLDEAIEDGQKYIIFIDDANSYPKLMELLDFIKYRNIDNNIKVIMTIRDYLKNCLNSNIYVEFYNVKPLESKFIREAIIKNTSIKNLEWIKQIAKIANGNIRVAFLAASEAIKDGRTFGSLFNQTDVLNRFYKVELSKIDNSEKLIISAGIVSFFKSVYLEQLFYIAPILKNVGLSKQDFIENINILISMELIDDYIDVVKISDQCFADFLLNYTIMEKKYLKIKDLILIGFKYYKIRIVESVQTILNNFCTKECSYYFKEEVIAACNQLEDNISLKHEIEACFAQIIPEYASLDYIKGVESYSDEKDIKWLFGIFENLAFSDYADIANNGIFTLLTKTKDKQKEIYDIIKIVYGMKAERIDEQFKYLISFIKELQNRKLYDSLFIELISSYLKFRINYSSIHGSKINNYCCYVNDDTKGIIELRTQCWNYLFDSANAKVIDEIINFACCYYSDGCIEIIKNDLKCIYDYLCNYDANGLLKTILYVKFIDDAEKHDFIYLLSANSECLELTDLVLERKLLKIDNYDDYQKEHIEEVRKYYNFHKDIAYHALSLMDDLLEKYFKIEKSSFLNTLIEVIDELTDDWFLLFAKNDVLPSKVIEKYLKSNSIKQTYLLIQTIEDKSFKDKYLFFFYRHISKADIADDYAFLDWIASKEDKDIKQTCSKNVLDLRNIAEKNGLTYVALIRKLFSKRKYNTNIAKSYLSDLIYNIDAFKELLVLNKKLAIDIYEFLLKEGAKIHNPNLIKEILHIKRSYIKTIAQNFLDNDRYDDCIKGIVFDKEYCDAFFDECMSIFLATSSHFVPIKLQILFTKCEMKNNILNTWIEKYIDNNYKNSSAIKLLFQALAQIDNRQKSKYLIQYYQKGKDSDILKSAIYNKTHSYNNAKEYFENEINWLQDLKKAFLKWDKSKELSIIDVAIANYNNDIKNEEIECLIGKRQIGRRH